MTDTPEKKIEAPTPQIDQILFKFRTITIFGEITPELAQQVTRNMLALAAESNEPIRMLINSPGGHVESGDTIHDMIRFVDAPIHVIGTGYVASAGVLIYLGAKKENRYALPNTRFLLHQPHSSGMRGVASDIKIYAQEIVHARERLNKIISKETGMDLEKVKKDTERDFWLSAEDAKKYGLVQHIIHHSKDIK